MELASGSAASPRGAARPLAWAGRLSPAGWVLAATAAASCVFAFVGLSASSWWTDELFTLFVIDGGGPADVVRRSLTDTHPPAYYLLLHAWAAVFGLHETALRSLSAILAVSALLVFLRTSRGLFTREARLFAAALATTSPIWFFQAQNIRNYSVCFLLTAVMLHLALGLRRAVRAGRPPLGRLAALGVVGLLDASSHFYGLLAAGALIAALIVTFPSWRLRGALAACGLVILGCALAYMRVLVGRTHEDLHHLWFRNDALHLLRVPYDVLRSSAGGSARGAVGLLLAAWAATAALRAPVAATAEATAGEGGAADADARADRAWLLGVCAFLPVAVYAGGVAVSVLFAPSLSDRNVLTAAPALWVLSAGLYEAAVRRLRPGPRLAVTLAAATLTALVAVSLLQGRLLPRNEEWRASAAYVASRPHCAGAEVAVMQPDRFGPDTPFYRTLAERDFFGRYLPPGGPRPRSHPRAAFLDGATDPAFTAALVARSHDPAACPVLAWAVHDVLPWEGRALLAGVERTPGMGPVRMRTFAHMHRHHGRWTPLPSGFVIERAEPPPPPGRV